MQPNLTAEEVQYIAAMPEHPGWSLFRDMVQSTHDALLNALAVAETQEKVDFYMKEWKMYRALLAHMQSMDAWATDMQNQLVQAQQWVQNQHQSVTQTPDTKLTNEEFQQITTGLRGGQQAAPAQAPTPIRTLLPVG